MTSRSCSSSSAASTTATATDRVIALGPMAPSADVPTDHEIIHALADDLPVGLWVARAPGGEFVYANRMFAEIMGQGGRDDTAVGSYAEPYGIFTRTGERYPEDRMPIVRALRERHVDV